jgi:hypothetical protein
MEQLTKAEKQMVAGGLCGMVVEGAPGMAIAMHALANRIAEKLECTTELREAARDFTSYAKLRAAGVR